MPAGPPPTIPISHSISRGVVLVGPATGVEWQAHRKIQTDAVSTDWKWVIGRPRVGDSLRVWKGMCQSSPSAPTFHSPCIAHPKPGR